MTDAVLDPVEAYKAKLRGMVNMSAPEPIVALPTPVPATITPVSIDAVNRQAAAAQAGQPARDRDALLQINGEIAAATGREREQLIRERDNLAKNGAIQWPPTPIESPGAAVASAPTAPAIAASGNDFERSDARAEQQKLEREQRDALKNKGVLGFTKEDLAGAIVGGGLGATFGKTPTPNSTGVVANLAERVTGAPSGSLLQQQALIDPTSPEVTARHVAENRVPAVPVAPVAEVAPPEPPKEAAVRWVAGQVGSGSSVPENLVSQTTSYYANDPTGAPALIQENAKNVRKSREIFGHVNTLPSGLLTTGRPETPDEMRARIKQELLTKNEQIAATSKALNDQHALEDAREAQVREMTGKVRKASGLSNLVQNTGATALNILGTVSGGMMASRAISDSLKRGVNDDNVSQFIEGGGLVAAARNPRALIASGGAGLYRAAKDMIANGLTPENAAQGASGLGQLAYAGGMKTTGVGLQIPSLYLAGKGVANSLTNSEPTESYEPTKVTGDW